MIGDNFMWFPGDAWKGQDIAGISGETNDEWFAKEKAFELLSFNFKIECGDTTTGGEGAGKGKFGEFNITKGVDTASVPLYKACSLGDTFPNAMLAIRKSGGDNLLYLQYIFRAVRVASITWEGGSGAERPKETMSFIFKAMGMQYVMQRADGTGAPKGVSWYWNAAVQGTDRGSSSLTIPGIADPPSPVFLNPVQTYVAPPVSGKPR